MKVKLKKKTFLSILIVSSIFLLAVILIHFRSFNNKDSVITPVDLLYKCKEFGCIENDQDTYKKSFSITILSFKEERRYYLLNINLWNSKTNDIINSGLKIKKSLVTKFDPTNETFPRSFVLTVSSKRNIFPLPYISDYFDKILFTTESVTEIAILDTQENYLNEDNNYNYKSLLSDIKNSINNPEGVSESGKIPSMLFIFNDVLSYGFGDQTNYDQILLYEILDVAKEKTAQDLSNNCTILKKYYPNNQCNPSFSDLKTSMIDQILDYNIPHYDIEEIVYNSIIADTYTIEEKRSDSKLWAEYYSSKNLTIAYEIEKYSTAFLQFLYSSHLSCSDGRYSDVCNQIYKLYEYSKFLTTLSDGNLCTHISYLPLLASVSENEDIINELKYVLNEYPFTSECIYSNESSGFCSVDLEERFSCMKLMYDSINLFGDDYEITDDLKEVTDFSLNSNLNSYNERVGLWGEEDINLLTSGTPTETYYPVRFYDIRGNYLVYKILNDFYND